MADTTSSPDSPDADAPNAPDPEMPDATAPEPDPEAAEADDDLPVNQLMHGDGHAAIPEIPSIESDGSLDIERLGPDHFDPDELRQRLRTMMLSRRLDEKMLTLLKQGKGHFHIGC